MDKYSETAEVVASVKERVDIAPFARKVGAWVWVEFQSKPSEETRAFLKASGFRWNKERGAWQHPCGIFRARNRRIDPRAYYGQAYIQDQLTGAV